MILWRIAAETREYKADDLSGAAAAKYPGRWNDAKEPVIYCAQSIPLSVLETAAHVDDSGLPLNRFLVRIDVPERVWALREKFDFEELPATWAAIPAGRASVKIGSEWLSSLRTAALLVPSVIVPEEHCVVINPRHSDAARISAHVVRQFEYNRLFGS